MTKIYAQGNYIVIEANNERNTFPKRDVRFKVVDEDGIYSLSSQELPISNFNYSEVKKEDGSDYTIALEFETFLFENTGNFNSGADSSPNYIPLTGTEEGKPVTGDVELNYKDYVGYISSQSVTFNKTLNQYTTYDYSIIEHVENNRNQYIIFDKTVGYPEYTLNGILIAGSGDINDPQDRFVGLEGFEDFSELFLENKLIYAQRQYVERPQTLINCLNNATPEQLSTIKSILGIV